MNQVTTSHVLHFLADLTVEDQEGRHRKGQHLKPTIATLSWMANTTTTTRLADIMTQRAVTNFGLHHSPTNDRKEASPLPLSAIVGLERWLRHDSCPNHLILILGFTLVGANTSLRFGDMQRCRPDTISSEDGILRGMC